MASNFKLFGLKSLKKWVKKLLPTKNQEKPLKTHPPIPYTVSMEKPLNTHPPSPSFVSMGHVNTHPPNPLHSPVLMENSPTHPPGSSVMKSLPAPLLISSTCHALIPWMFPPHCQDFKEQEKVMRPLGRDNDRNLLTVSKWDKMGMVKMEDSLGGVKYGVPYGAKPAGMLDENKMGIGWFEQLVSVQYN